MRFPDEVTVVAATRFDEYGNPKRAFTGDEKRTPATGFLVSADQLLLPSTVKVAAADRIETRGRLYAVTAVEEIRSPSKTVLWSATVQEVRR